MFSFKQVAAEHNSFISKQLQCTIKDKDGIISNLQNDIEKLKRVQQSQAENKMALCQEIAEVRYARKQLHDELAMEKQKAEQLNETKDEIEKLAESRVRCQDNKSHLLIIKCRNYEKRCDLLYLN